MFTSSKKDQFRRNNTDIHKPSTYLNQSASKSNTNSMPHPTGKKQADKNLLIESKRTNVINQSVHSSKHQAIINQDQRSPKDPSDKKQTTRIILGGEKKQDYEVQEMQMHKRILEEMWEYRYWKYVEYAIKSKDWIKVFAFLGQFKTKCLQLAKYLVSQKFKIQQIDTSDHRNDYKQNGEIGIYLIDGIIIRVGKQFNNNGKIDKETVKNLHQQFLGGNVLNNLIISLRIQKSDCLPLKVPLQCLTKYLGYTFLFQADTLCQGIETLLNGPMNITYQYHEEVQPVLRLIGNNLNLKSFKVINDNKVIEIPFCLTIEVHRIKIALRDINLIDWINPESIIYPHNHKDNILVKPQYYLLNFAKLWPLFIDSNIISSSGYLRPQATISWKRQLSNVVFSNITFQKDQFAELQLAEASKYVKEESIKALVTLLDEATFFAVDSSTIQELLHEYGINIRFLGEITSKFTLSYNRKIFEVQMASRILKKVFFISARDFQDQYSIKDLFVDFLNLVFCQNKEGQSFWRNTVYKNIEKYYSYQMKEYPPIFQGGGLLHAISYHCGIKVKIIDYPFFKDVQAIFSLGHILDITGLVKTYDLETSHLKKFCEKYKSKKRQGIFSEAIDALNLLVSIHNQSDPEGTYSVGSNPQSFFYSQLAQCYRNIDDYQTAIKYAQLALKGIPDKHADAIKAYCVLIRCHSQKKQMNRCLQYYQKSLTNLNYHLVPNHPLTISVYNTLGFQFLSSNDPAKCQKIFAKSFEICEQALGYMHMNSGKILLQLADLPLSPEKTINFLLQALTILQNIETDKQKVRIVSMKISEMYAKIGNLTKMIHFAKKSEHWRMEIIALEKLNQYKSVLQLCNRIPDNTKELRFLIEKSFSSYIKLIDYIPSNNLYKLFISLQQNLPKTQQSVQRVYKKLRKETKLTTTTVDFVRSILTSLIVAIPDILQQADFFVGFDFLLEYKSSKLKNCLLSYMDILAIVGIPLTEKIFTELRKTF